MFASIKTIAQSGWLLALVILGTLSATTALARPLEINQSCAAGGGCFPGDAPGFPVEITSPGSYALTGNLTVASNDTHGIYVRAFGTVTIDMRGFSLRGPISCTGLGSAVSCDAGSGHGVFVDLPVQVENPLRLFDGEISGFADTGVLARRHARLDRLRVHGNGDDGISAFSGSIITDCTVEQNGDDGIVAVDTIVSGVTSRGNGHTGLALQTSIAEGSSAREEGSWGITGAVSIVRDSAASASDFSGGFFSSSTLITGTSFTGNDNVGVYLNGVYLRDATVEGNGGSGIFAQQDSAYRSVTASANGGVGDVSVSAGVTLVDLGENACSGALCP